MCYRLRERVFKQSRKCGKAVNDVLAYYDKRTDEQNLKSITAKITKIRQEVSKLTDVFVKVKLGTLVT